MNDLRSTPGLTAALLALAAIGLAGPLAAAPLRAHAGPYRIEALASGTPLPTFAHGGETFVLGELGTRYTLRVVNQTGARIEAVVSVDGLDVIDGKPADAVAKRGYVVPAWGSVDIDGFRISGEEAAAFRFSRVADSYAARTGRPRNVGVVGVAVYAEQEVPRPIAAARPRVPAQWSRGAEAEADRSQAPPAGTGPAPDDGAVPPPSPSTPETTGLDGGSADAASRVEERAEAAPREALRRPGLGTEFGEAVHSPVREVSFHRAHHSRPDATLGFRYDDRRGLLAMGVDLDRFGEPEDAETRLSAEPFPSRTYAEPPAGWRR